MVRNNTVLGTKSRVFPWILTQFFFIHFLLKPLLFQAEYHTKCKRAEINSSFKFNKCLEIEI